MDKCKFGVSSLEYLGHHIDATGIKPIADKVQAIVNFPTPSNMRQLRRLIGMIAFYKKFIPNCSEITRPIFALLLPDEYSKKAIEWTKDADDAFQEVLNKLCSPVTLTFPVENAPTYLVTDCILQKVYTHLVHLSLGNHPISEALTCCFFFDLLIYFALATRVLPMEYCHLLYLGNLIESFVMVSELY